MNRSLSSTVVAGLLAAVLLAGCGLLGGGTELALVAGGGDDPAGTTPETVQLRGTARDLAVRDGVVHLLVTAPGGDAYIARVEPDGSVSTTDLGDLRGEYLAAGPDATVYVVAGSAIYQVDGSGAPVRVVAAENAPDDGQAAARATGSIQGLDVDDAGRLVWTEGFLGTGPDGAEPPLVRVQRLDDGEVEHLAGAASVDVPPAELVGIETSPPAGQPAVDIPLRRAGSGGALAVDGDDIYLGADRTLLRLDGQGTLEAIAGPGDRRVPERPFDDRGDAGSFGALWGFASMDASGGVVVGADRTLDLESVDVEPFEWSGELGPAQELADIIVRRPTADGTVNLRETSTALGDVAVVVRNGEAATAMAHVAKVGVEDGVLYAVGQTPPPRRSQGHDALLLIVRADLPDD